MQKCDICSKLRDATASSWRTITHRELKDSPRLIAYGLRIKANASPDRMVSLGNGQFFRLEVDDSMAELPSTVRDAYLAEVERRFGESDWLLCPDCQEIRAGGGSHRATEQARGRAKSPPKAIAEQAMSQTWKERFHQDNAAQREIIEAMEAQERALARMRGATYEKPASAPTLERVAEYCLNRGPLALDPEIVSHAKGLLCAVRSDTAEEAKSHLVKVRKSENSFYALCARVMLACIDAAETDSQQAGVSAKPDRKVKPLQTRSQTWKERFHQDDTAQREVIELMEIRERALASARGTCPEKLPDAPNALELVAQCCLKDKVLWLLQSKKDKWAAEYSSDVMQLFGAVRSDTADEARSRLVKICNSKNEIYARCARFLLAWIDAAEKDAQQAAAAKKEKKVASAVPTAAPDRLRFSCPECGKAVIAPLAAAGKKAPCPGCKKLIVLPQPAAAAPAKIAVVCSCGKRIVVSVGLAGKRFKCPECGSINRVPSEAERKAEVPSESGSPQKAAKAPRDSAEPAGSAAPAGARPLSKLEQARLQGAPKGGGAPAKSAKAQRENDVAGTVRVLNVCPRCKHRWTSRHDPQLAPLRVACPKCGHQDDYRKVMVGGLWVLSDGTPEHLLPPE